MTPHFTPPPLTAWTVWLPGWSSVAPIRTQRTNGDRHRVIGRSTPMASRATASCVRAQPALLGPGADGGMSHPSEPHAHPDAQPWANPVEPTPESVRAGADTYASMCATCHGPTGRGDGRLAAATAAYGARPSNLADEVWQHGATVGEIFATIRDGVGPDYAMDGFGSRLTDTEIWNLVNYLRGFR